MSNGIVWEEPPPTALFAGQKRGSYTEFAAALREHPGRWGVLPGERKTSESAKNTAQNVRRGVMKDFPKGQFETAVDHTKVYVRFVGDDQQDGPAKSQSAAPASEGGADEPADSKRIRAWGRANGFDLPDRGRMPAEVYEAYRRAHAAYTRPGDDDSVE